MESGYATADKGSETMNKQNDEERVPALGEAVQLSHAGLPILCLSCSHELSTCNKVLITSKDSIRDFNVTTAAEVCPNCGMQFMTNEQMNELRRLVKEQWTNEDSN